jgi:hypothetical protein
VAAPCSEAAAASQRASRVAVAAAEADDHPGSLEAARVSSADHELELEEVSGSRPSGAQIVGNYLSAAAIFAGLAALVYYPGRIGPGAIVVALVAAGLGSTVRGLSLAGVAFAAGGFTLGMIVAVVIERPIF